MYSILAPKWTNPMYIGCGSNQYCQTLSKSQVGIFSPFRTEIALAQSADACPLLLLLLLLLF